MPPPDPTAFRREQRRVAAGMAAAALLTALILAAGLAAAWRGSAPPAGDRLAAALRIDLLLVACPMAMVARLAARRFFSPEAIAGSARDAPGSPAAEVNAVLRNTVEQLALAVPVHLCLATLLPVPGRLLTGMALAFAAGRALFWRGYRGGAASRSLGFGLTFYPTAAGFALACALALVR